MNHPVDYEARLFKHKIDSISLRFCFGLAVPPRFVRRRDFFAVPFARVETVKNGLFCRAPCSINELLRACDKVDFFSDSLSMVKTEAKAYAKQLTLAAYPFRVSV